MGVIQTNSFKTFQTKHGKTRSSIFVKFQFKAIFKKKFRRAILRMPLIILGIPLIIHLGIPLVILLGIPLIILQVIPPIILLGIPLIILQGVPLIILLGIPLIIIRILLVRMCR